MWFKEPVGTEEVAFEADVFLLRKNVAQALRAGGPPEPLPTLPPAPDAGTASAPEPGKDVSTTTLRLVGTVPAELWNRLGTKILPKLRSGSDLKVGVDFSVTVSSANAAILAAELRQVLKELGLDDAVRVE